MSFLRLVFAPVVLLYGAAALEGGEVGVVNVSLPGDSTVMGAAFKGTRAYWNLRFAEADRFAAPRVWSPPPGSLLDARQPQPTRCTQKDKSGMIVGVEDCLFLDVYAPQSLSVERAPVMVFIHGGGLILGSKNSVHGLHNFAKEGDVVVVAINYRLNVFGFFASTDPTEPKNLGIRDQIAALEWVQQNAASFGGDPDRVTIFGQSAGGLSVMVLLQSPLAHGLFHRAIAQSPGFQTSAQFHQPVDEVARTIGQKCLEAAGCTSTSCLRALPMRDVAASCDDYNMADEFVSDLGRYFTGFDGEVLPKSIYEPFCSNESAANSHVPLIVGSTPNEWRFFQHAVSSGYQYDAHFQVSRFLTEHLPGYAEGGPALQSCLQQRLLEPYSQSEAECPLCSAFNDSASMVQLAGDIAFTLGAYLQAKAPGGARYRYLFDDEDGGGSLGATHTSDINYFAADPAAVNNGWAGLDMAGTGVRVEEKANLGRMLRQYWTSFAHTGVPVSSTGPTWGAVEHGRSLPMLQFGLGALGAVDGPKMLATDWYSDAAADLLGRMSCGRVRLATSLSGSQCGWRF